MPAGSKIVARRRRKLGGETTMNQQVIKQPTDPMAMNRDHYMVMLVHGDAQQMLLLQPVL